ncbi:winged helix-turn-helix domain-containing protein [Sandaracinus amylolyticus]|uniref:winged helix-turn-helix domain-containing protein n=1 Tax=Sandaracinus amylolyticus TaxID=927083 RepID=UPI001F01F015|nr:winged helix-turn-helix domain-containing protein [Sandaracinus amylolyticus]UJR80157.1 Hypothetical protein I5071_22010 [Sandaracinus amylolyticus]
MGDEELEIDLAKRRIRRGGEDVVVQRRVFDLITYLMQERGRAVSRAELLRHVWNDVHVSEASLNQAVRAARRAIGDDPVEPRRILTLRGYGYRWIDEPREVARAPSCHDETVERDDARGSEEGAVLFVVAGADGADVTPSAHALEGIDEIDVVRTARSGVVREGRTLVLGVASALLSRRHARIVRRPGGRFVLEDGGSKNGTRLDGRRVERVELRDGDWIGCGPLLLRFRSGMGAPLEERSLPTISPALARDVDAAARVLEDGVAVLVVASEGTDTARLARTLATLAGRRGAFVSWRARGADDDDVQLAERLDAARGGTLHVTHVDALDPRVIARLASAIEPRSEGEPPLDVAVVASAAADDGLLAAALGAHALRVPLLADRREDLGLLLAVHAPGVVWSPAALDRLAMHRWPGDERELAATIRAARALATRGVIEVDHLPASLR